LYAHSLALPHRLCFCPGEIFTALRRTLTRVLMFEINLLWPNYGLSRTIEIYCTQHLYQQNSFAVKSVVHSGMAFLPGRPLELECIRDARDVRGMVPSDVLSHDFISVTVAAMHLTLYVAALKSEPGDCRTSHKSSKNWSSSVYRCYIWKTPFDKLGFDYKLMKIENHGDSTALVQGPGPRRSTASELQLLCSLARGV
jgi:hypothetical protein